MSDKHFRHHRSREFIFVSIIIVSRKIVLVFYSTLIGYFIPEEESGKSEGTEKKRMGRKRMKQKKED